MTLVRDLMRRGAQTIAPDVSLTDAATSLRGSGIRALPVPDGNRLVGITTDRDMWKKFVVA